MLAAVARRITEKSSSSMQVIVCSRFFSLKLLHDMVSQGPLKVLGSIKQMNLRVVDDLLFEKHLTPEDNIEQDLVDLSETSPFIVYCAFDKHAEKLYKKVKPLQNASGLVRKHSLEDIEVIEEFKRGEKKILIIKAIISRSKTVEQCPLVVVYSAPYNLKHYSNVIGRPILPNHKAKCIIVSSSETNIIKDYRQNLQSLLSIPNDFYIPVIERPYSHCTFTYHKTSYISLITPIVVLQ